MGQKEVLIESASESVRRSEMFCASVILAGFASHGEADFDRAQA